MIQGTTPTIRLKIDALDLTQCHDIHVTLKQAGHDRRDFSGAALAASRCLSGGLVKTNRSFRIGAMK